MSPPPEFDRPAARRVLFISLEAAHFVEADRELLSRAFEVRSFQFSGGGRSRIGIILRAFEQLVWLLREAPRADLIYGWFVDYHMFLPVWIGRVFRRPVVAVLGGFDGNALPQLRYGVFSSRWRAPLARIVLRRLTLLLPTTGALISSRNDYATYPDEHRDGVLAHVPELQTPHRVVPLGIDTGSWPMGPGRRGPETLTVAFVGDERTLKIKGIDVYLDVAACLPDVRFTVVGIASGFEAWIRDQYRVPPNVDLVPPQPQERLSPFYQSASVYLQLSRTEALPNVVKEAMCSGCIPIGSAVAGIPEIIGGAGLLVETPEPDEIAAVVRRALEGATPERRHAARRRITEYYDHERRRRILLETLSAVMESPTAYG